LTVAIPKDMFERIGINAENRDAKIKIMDIRGSDVK